MLLVMLAAVSVLGSAAAAQQTPSWSIAGVKLVFTPEPPPPPIDIARVQRQKARGCEKAGALRFGDTAMMRETVSLGPWPRPLRQLMAGAAFTDDREMAYRLLREALDGLPPGEAMTAAVENTLLMTMLQFRDFMAYAREAETYGDVRMDGPLQADRLFMRAYALMRDPTGQPDWDRISDLIERAHQLDPAFFSVVALRVLAWIEREASARGVSDCNAAARSLSDRVLDVSDVAVCPLLLAHTDHFLARELRMEAASARPGKPEVASWRAYAAAVMAATTRQRAAFDAAKSAIAGMGSSAACKSEILTAIDAISPQ